MTKVIISKYKTSAVKSFHCLDHQLRADDETSTVFKLSVKLCFVFCLWLVLKFVRSFEEIIMVNDFEEKLVSYAYET